MRIDLAALPDRCGRTPAATGHQASQDARPARAGGGAGALHGDTPGAGSSQGRLPAGQEEHQRSKAALLDARARRARFRVRPAWNRRIARERRARRWAIAGDPTTRPHRGSELQLPDQGGVPLQRGDRGDQSRRAHGQRRVHPGVRPGRRAGGRGAALHAHPARRRAGGPSVPGGHRHPHHGGGDRAAAVALPAGRSTACPAAEHRAGQSTGRRVPRSSAAATATGWSMPPARSGTSRFRSFLFGMSLNRVHRLLDGRRGGV